jgi:hypothetical protein
MLVPTLNLFRGGEVVKQVIGGRSRSALMREFADFLQRRRLPLHTKRGAGHRACPPSLRRSLRGQPTL